MGGRASTSFSTSIIAPSGISDSAAIANFSHQPTSSFISLRESFSGGAGAASRAALSPAVLSSEPASWASARGATP